MAFDLQTQLSKFLQTWYAGNFAVTGVASLGDGTSGAPSLAFTSEATLGFWRSAAGIVNFTGTKLNVAAIDSTTGTLTLGGTANISVAGSVTAGNLVANTANTVGWLSKARMNSTADGNISLTLFDQSIGSRLKVDALPTVASGFGTSPSVTAGSTPLAGSVNVGTGGVATSGVINFNGTAFPTAPYPLVTSSLTNAVIRATASTTQLTITCTTAFTASDVISWACISSK